MKTIKISFKIFLFFTILTGIAYPLLITGIAQIVFSDKANGSLIVTDNQIIGSELIGQQFDSSIYFSSRPSASTYNPMPSGGSNYGVANLKLKNLVDERKYQFITFNQLDTLATIPSEMLFASASGLDPHISPEAAKSEVNRISDARNFNDNQKQRLFLLIEDMTERPQFTVLGEPRLNVLKLNLELNRIQKIEFNIN